LRVSAQPNLCVKSSPTRSADLGLDASIQRRAPRRVVVGYSGASDAARDRNCAALVEELVSDFKPLFVLFEEPYAVFVRDDGD
jgi:hypothetical protein